jgi:hypothetical protein
MTKNSDLTCWTTRISKCLRTVAIVFATIPFISSCQSRQPKEVLFIGNSLTYYHDMPAMLQEMLREKHSTINIHQSTEPGVSLNDHLTSEKTRKKLNSQSWDFVVLQEGTVRALIPEVMQYQLRPTVIKLDSIIRVKGGRTILYESYPVSKYPAKYCYPSFMISNTLIEKDYCSVELHSSDQEFKIIQNSFSELSNSINGDIAFVGTCFESCKRKFPELMLFESKEDTHPSKLGSYLIACVFFRVLTGESVNGISYNAGLELNDTKKIKEIVDSN